MCFMEEWVSLQDYPGYSVSNFGRIRNDKREALLTITYNQQGVGFVGLMRDSVQVKRGLAHLVCETFVPKPTHAYRIPFTTPIHLNGEPHNCEANNLLWRPRWFAIKHAIQFRRDLPKYPNPIRETRSGEIFDNSWNAVLTHGLLYTELIISIFTKTYVFPTMQTYEWVE